MGTWGLPFPVSRPRNLTVDNIRPDLAGLVCILLPLCTEFNRSINMTESKFVEILDNSFVPRSQANANLDDVLAETRARSSSATATPTSPGPRIGRLGAKNLNCGGSSAQKAMKKLQLVRQSVQMTLSAISVPSLHTYTHLK